MWASLYDGAGYYDDARAVAVSPDGLKIFVTGSPYAPDASQKTNTIAYRSDTRDSGKNEGGPLSGPIHDGFESDLENDQVHGVSCEVLVGQGL